MPNQTIKSFAEKSGKSESEVEKLLINFLILKKTLMNTMLTLRERLNVCLVLMRHNPWMI